MDEDFFQKYMLPSCFGQRVATKKGVYHPEFGEASPHFHPRAMTIEAIAQEEGLEEVDSSHME